LSLNRRRNDVYNLILIIINKYTKIVKYILIIKKITVIKLANIFINNIIFKYENSKEKKIRLKFNFYQRFLTKSLLLFKN
jgi:hypothetical protein